MVYWHPSTKLRGHRSRRAAFITLEVLVAIGFTATLAFLMAATTLQYATVRREHDTRRALRLAAIAEIARIRADGSAALAGRNGPPATQPDGTAITTTATPGEGVWSGLICVHVAASRMVPGARRIEVEVAAYVPGRGWSP